MQRSAQGKRSGAHLGAGHDTRSRRQRTGSYVAQSHVPRGLTDDSGARPWPAPHSPPRPLGPPQPVYRNPKAPNARVCEKFARGMASPERVNQMTTGLMSRGMTIEQGWDCLEYMRSVGAPADTLTYSAFINMCVKASDINAALSVLKDMVRKGVERDAATYDPLLRYAEDRGDIDLEEEIVRRMRDDGLERPAPNESVCKKFAKGLTDSDHVCRKTVVMLGMPQMTVGRAWDCLDAMRRVGVPANTIVYNAFINMCVKKGEIDAALSVLKDMVRKGVAPDSDTCAPLFRWCAERRDIEFSETYIVPIMRAARMQELDIQKFRISLRADAGDFDGVDKILNDASFRHNADVDAYTRAIRGCRNSGDLPRAKGYFAMLLAAGLSPDAICCTVLMGVCVKDGNVAAMEEFWCWMPTRGNQRKDEAYSVAIEVCGKAQDWQKASELLVRGVEDGTLKKFLGYAAAVGRRRAELDFHQGAIFTSGHNAEVGVSPAFAHALFLYHRDKLVPNMELLVGRGEGVLRQTIIDCLDAQDIPWREVPGNPGSLMISPDWEGGARAVQEAPAERRAGREAALNEDVCLQHELYDVGAHKVRFETTKKLRRATAEEGWQSMLRLADADVPPDLPLLTALLQTCASHRDNRDVPKAWMYALVVVQYGFDMDVSFTNCLIPLRIHLNDIEGAEQAAGFAPVNERSTAFCNYAIRLYAQLGKLADTLGIFEHMPEAGVRRNLETYRIVISACNDAGKSKQAAQLRTQGVNEGVLSLT